MNHIDHVVKIAGINQAGLGSDYDGVIQVPTQINFSARSDEQRPGRALSWFKISNELAAALQAQARK